MTTYTFKRNETIEKTWSLSIEAATTEEAIDRINEMIGSGEMYNALLDLGYDDEIVIDATQTITWADENGNTYEQNI